LVDGVDPLMTLVRKETFGLVSPIIRLDTLDDAIRISNGTPFGLPSGVCTNWRTRSCDPSTNCGRGGQRVGSAGLPDLASAVRRHAAPEARAVVGNFSQARIRGVAITKAFRKQ
jgi:hypothetical protein